MKLTRPLIVVLATLAAALGAYVMLTRHETAPDVPLMLLDGRSPSVQALRGQVVVVNFWATSCSTCMREMPHLVELHQRLGARGLRVVAVAMSYDPPDYVRQFAKSRALPFDVALDGSGQVASSFGPVQLTPTTVVIDRQGRVVKRYVGEPDYPAFNALIEKLLGEPA